MHWRSWRVAMHWFALGEPVSKGTVTSEPQRQTAAQKQVSARFSNVVAKSVLIIRLSDLQSCNRRFHRLCTEKRYYPPNHAMLYALY